MWKEIAKNEGKKLIMPLPLLCSLIIPTIFSLSKALVTENIPTVCTDACINQQKTW